MNPLAGDPRVAALAEATAELTKPGQPFETLTDVVRGERMTVFANRPRSLRAILEAGAARGEADCYVFGDGRRISFAGMQRQAAAIAAALQSRYDIGPGDRVAICAANCPEWIQLFWAVASLNAVLVAMNGWWTGVEMANGLALTEPKLLVMDDKRRERLETDPGAPLLLIERDFAALLTEQDAQLPTLPIDEDDPFMLIFTSGTTGRPKAAVLSHRCVIGYLQLQSFLGARGLALAGRTPGSPPVRLAPFPLFHVSGLSATVSTMMGAGVTVWPLGRFDPEAVIELTRQEGIGVWSGATTHVMRLLDSPAIDTLDPQQIVQIGVGGSATTPALMKRAGERFPHLDNTMSTGYGSTETGGLATWAPNWMLQAAIDCVGPALPTVEVRITDETGAPVPDGTEGNVEVRCPNVMLGYWRNDAANAETLLPGLWVRTGDFGRWEDGLLFLASRKRDLILRGGENIYPFEIENRLEEQPDVLEAAVIGVEDAVLGQEVAAVVVVRQGSEIDAETLRAFCSETLASYKVPAVFDIRTSPLPRNATGKIMKHALADEAPAIFVEE
jgi:acyl-CoA synthetase (AMP-forming)/AMP-acid ligase II